MLIPMQFVVAFAAWSWLGLGATCCCCRNVFGFQMYIHQRDNLSVILPIALIYVMRVVVNIDRSTYDEPFCLIATVLSAVWSNGIVSDHSNILWGRALRMSLMAALWQQPRGPSFLFSLFFSFRYSIPVVQYTYIQRTHITRQHRDDITLES